MSGGHFDYIQYRLEDVGKELIEIGMIDENHSKLVRTLMIELGDKAIEVACKLHHLDWYLCADTGEETMLKRWGKPMFSDK